MKCVAAPSVGRELIGDPIRYRDRLCRALAFLDLNAVNVLARWVVDVATAGNRLFLAGNGGSASTVGHYACDLSQNFLGQGARVSIRNLAESPAAITALANDHAFEDIFRRQLLLEVQTGDLLILVSASGQSANVLQAARAARERQATVVGITGFDGGVLREMADLSIHVDERHYGVIEDVHLSIGHMLSQAISALLISRRQDAMSALTR